MSSSEMTFAEFSALNRKRCTETFHVPEDWPIEMWSLAIAGEAGELCNLVKKVHRGDFTMDEKRTEVLRELADVVTYCDLAIAVMGGQTAEVLMEKFDIVSARHGWKPS